MAYDPRSPRTVEIYGDESSYDSSVDETAGVTRMLPPEELPPSMMTPEAIASRTQGLDPSYDINRRFSERKRSDARQVDRDAHIERVAENLASFSPPPHNRIDRGYGDGSYNQVLAYPPSFEPEEFSSDELAADFVHSELGTGRGRGPLGERRLMKPGDSTNALGYTLSLSNPRDLIGVEAPADWSDYRAVAGSATQGGKLPDEDTYDELEHAETYPGGGYNPQYMWSLYHDEHGEIPDSQGREYSPHYDDFEEHVWADAESQASAIAGANFDADTRLERMLRQQGVAKTLKDSKARNVYGNRFVIHPDEIPD